MPYANSDLHIGHARSTYIPADIYVRFHRLNGNEVYYVCGTDEHGTPISVLAEKQGVKPIEITNKIYQKDVEDFKKLNISFDNFSRTSRPLHYETTQWFFKKLFDEGLIYSEIIKLPFCEDCSRYLPDRYVTGKCPYCGFEDARGDECDSCSRALTLDELEKPKCAICDSPANYKESEHWFLKLSSFEDWLLKWINEKEDLLPIMGRSHLINSYLKPGLKDVCISRDLNWGVPIPLKRAKDKVCYVWFDAPIGYIDSTKELFIKKNDPDGWKQFWQSNNTELIHFIGKGILYHHTLFWPSILKGTNYRLPNKIVAFSYGNLEGRKMSKSRGWYLSINDFLSIFEADSLRYYWIAATPLSEDADFVLDEFSNRYNNELADTLGNFVHRALVFCSKYFDSIIPGISNKKEEKIILEKITETTKIVEDSIEKFELREGLLSIIGLARFGNKYFNDTAPWENIKKDLNKAKDTIALCIKIVKAIGVLILPYLPDTGNKIIKMLNLNINEIKWSDTNKSINTNHKILKPKVLFHKIEEDRLNDLRKNLEKIHELKQTEPEIVTIEQFGKTDIRIGQIIEAITDADSDNNYKLKIKLNEDKIFLSSIKLSKTFSKEKLIGLKVLIVTNISEYENKNKYIKILKVKDENGDFIPVILDKDIQINSKIN